LEDFQQEKDVVHGIQVLMEKKSRKLRVRCNWVGLITSEKLKAKCVIRKKSKGVTQKFCCNWIRKCIGKNVKV